MWHQVGTEIYEQYTVIYLRLSSQTKLGKCHRRKREEKFHFIVDMLIYEQYGYGMAYRLSNTIDWRIYTLSMYVLIKRRLFTVFQPNI